MLASSAERFADLVAIRDGDVSLTYPELAEAARQFAAALVESGVEPGDRVAIWCFNCVEWVVAVLGIFSAGAVLVPINTRFKGPEAADMLARSGARALVTVTDFLDTDYVAMLEATGVPSCRRSRRSSSPTARRRATPSAGRTSSTAPPPSRWPRSERRSAALGPDDPSDILFTSGTTGVPKGRRDDARPHPDRGHRLGRHDRVACRGRLPAGQPVLPHVRPQGRHPGQRRRRRHHAPRARVRRGARADPRRVRARHRPAGSAHHLPGHPRPPDRARPTTSRACAWR